MVKPRKPVTPKRSYPPVASILKQARASDAGKLGPGFVKPSPRKLSPVGRQIQKRLIKKAPKPAEAEKYGAWKKSLTQKVKTQESRVRRSAARKMGRQISQQQKASAKARQSAIQGLAKKSKASAQAQAKAQQAKAKATKTAIKGLIQRQKAKTQMGIKTQKAQARVAKQQAQAKQAEQIKKTSNRILAGRMALKAYRKFVMAPASKMASYGRWNSSLW